MIAIDTMRATVFHAPRDISVGRFDPTPLITHRFSLAEIGEAYRVFSNRLDGVLKVAIKP